MSTTVLVIEDDLEINELIGEYLGLENIRYLQAETGQAGIHLATAQKPDVVILDLMLPDIDGFEVARALTSHRETYEIPIVILSCMCQDADKEKGFASGALFYMNKPFLPDDLLATLHKALEWKETLRDRAPAGTLILGGGMKVNGKASGEKADVAAGAGAAVGETMLCSCGINQMVADLFNRTNLPDAAVNDMREAAETLNTWARQWNTDHAMAAAGNGNGGGAAAGGSKLKLEYRIIPRLNGAPANGSGNGNSVANAAEVEWKLSEDAPGLLADAFFKAPNGTTGTGVGGGIMGWGAGQLVTKPLAPIAPPAKWLQVLAKTGAARFEKDSKTQTVRFARSAGNGGLNGIGSASGMVPVVEIDGMRFPTRLRDEALAAKRK